MGNPALEGIDYRIVVTECNCPGLQTGHMEKEAVYWYPFSNERAETVDADIFIPNLKDSKKQF